MFLAFFAFNEINNLRGFNVTFSSIPTAPTNHPSDWSELSKNARGQKGANSPDEFSAARVTPGLEESRH
jgi:hypothetical protein